MSEVTISTGTELAKNTRDVIMDIENILARCPGAIFGDNDHAPVKHTFSPGVYVREMTIPKGTIIVGKIHKHAHHNFLLSGSVVVITEENGREFITAPRTMISVPGTKRALVAISDTVWATIHHNPTDETDLEVLEENIICKSFAELDTFIAKQKEVIE